MARERYLSPEGFTVDVLEVFPYDRSGVACLVVQTNEDRDIRRSEINVCKDFQNEDPETVFSLPLGIYSMIQVSSDRVFIAHSAGVLRVGPHDDPQPTLETGANVTRLCRASRGVYVIGMDGYVGHFDGATMVDMPVEQSDDIYCVSEAPDGSVFASGGNGGLFRRERSGWVQVDLSTEAELYEIIALGRTDVILAGSDATCGRWGGKELTRYEVEGERDFYSVAIFKDRVYFGAGFRGLDILQGTAVIPLKDTVPAYHLLANEHYLFASGFNLLARFNGHDWLATEFT